MLRDTLEDASAGYFNIPREFLETHAISLHDVSSEPYRTWVRSRIQLARAYFEAGKGYIAQVQNFRCRIAGWAYIARFEIVSNAIEKDGYCLRPEYSESKNLRAKIKTLWRVFSMALDRNQRLANLNTKQSA
jgi:phytoene/squalene synthetase